MSSFYARWVHVKRLLFAGKSDDLHCLDIEDIDLRERYRPYVAEIKVGDKTVTASMVFGDKGWECSIEGDFDEVTVRNEEEP